MGVSQQAEWAQWVALAQPPAQPQQLDLSGMALSLRLWPNRRVATLLVTHIVIRLVTQYTDCVLLTNWWCSTPLRHFESIIG